MAAAKKLRVDWKGQAYLVEARREVEESEKSLSLRVRVAVAAQGVIIMRNNSGVDLRQGVAYGLGKGSADFVCVVPPYGRFLGLEIKRPKSGKVSEHQERWLAMIRRYGGVTGVVRSVEDALALVEEARKMPEVRRG